MDLLHSYNISKKQYLKVFNYNSGEYYKLTCNRGKSYNTVRAFNSNIYLALGNF
jgi:hypothetical protein